jgi:hypothetical protein
MPIYEQPRMRPGAEEVVYSSSSSSSSSSYIDISRKWPRKFGLRAFFTAPSERRRVRRRKSTRLFKIGNSSSSSVNSDLAYGTGFIKRPRRRSVRGRNGREFRGERREGYSDRESNGRSRVERRGEAGRPPLGRAQTEAEILAIGAGLAKLARDQNRHDLREGRNGSRPDLGAGISAPSYNGQGTSRGLVNSRPSHGADAVDEEGWESASDSEESVDSRLAFGVEGTSSGGFFGLFGRKKHRPLSRKGTIVDPQLFGPNNTLHGIVTEPVGFGEVTPWASTNDFGQQISDGPGIGPSHTGSQASLQRVYPVPTSDPGRFDARAASVISGPEPMVVSRPGPIPIQQPQPMTPVSQSVYGRTESDRISKRDSTSGRGKSLAEAALVGVAGAAVGAAVASSRDDRRRREEEEMEEKTRLRRRDSERDNKDDRRREKRTSPDREERKEKRREKDDSSRVSSDKRRERRKDETREERDERRERRRDDPRDGKDERREKPRSDRFDERGEARRTKSETAVPTTGVDPFQYQLADEQVPDDAFPARKTEPRTTEATPAVHYVTVEREPDFSRIAPIRDARTPDFMHMHRQNPPKYVDKDQGEQDQILRDRALHEAEEIYEETKHSTAPIAAAAIGAAVAAVHHADDERESTSEKPREERRGERRSDYDDYDSKPRDEKSGKEKDPIQEEADRAYREIVMARKIASQVIRSRTPSPNRSVTEKYVEEEEEEPIRIVTPPGMDDKKKVGPYDAPNADFQPDHVLENPAELRYFRVSQTNTVRVDSEGPYLKRDPDADRPRPFLNLVRPTPVPSPVPEKQAARSEPAKPSKSTDGEEQKQSTTSEIQSKDEAVDSPTSSSVSKGVTWGENETKHYEVESPAEHRDEFVSKTDYQAREAQEEHQPTAKPNPKSKGWGAIAAGIIGAGVGAAAANSSDTSKTSNSKEDQKKDAPYEYRGVVVEPESPSQSSNQRDAPPTGPKPSKTETSRVPGAFDDDIDFTATVAAGLQDSGFDPNIVIDDPSFRRRDSPPGSYDFKPYRAPFAETVSDLGSIPAVVSGARDAQGFIIGEVASTPQDWRSVSPPRDDETPIKLSKKEQKNRDKLARQGSQGDDITPSVAEELVEEPESYFETPKKSKKKSKKGSSSVDDYTEGSPRDSRKVSVPVDAFDDLRNDDDEWADAKKSKKLKRDSGRYDSPPRSVPSSEVASELSRSSSKKSKDKSKRKSEQYDPNPTEVPLPASTASEISRDGDYDDSRGSRKSSTRDSGIFNSADRGDSRSVVSADISRYDDDEPRKSKKKSRSSTKDDYDDSRSVVSAPAGDDYDDSKRSKKRDKDKEKEKDKKSGGGFFGLFGSKSDVGARDEGPKDNFEEPRKKKKSKRNSMADSSIYGDEGAQSVGDVSRAVPNGNGDRNGSYNSQDEENDDDRTEKSKTRSRSQSSSSKKDSFLGNAGTLGAGVGVAGAAVAIAAQQYQQSKAANANSRETIEHEQGKSSPSSILPQEIYDPEITERQFRPSIDPQYGDLLPLPPSNPVSPNVDPIDDLPELPESRPDTPEPERIAREKSLSTVRKNIQETPMKSPSQSAVPLNFLMRNRSQPASPRFIRSSPLQSPSTTAEDSLSFPRSRPRPTSWDSTKEYKPLYLVESHRRGSSAQLEVEDELPALPPSQQTSRSSSQLELDELAKGPLSIDTKLASSTAIEEPLGSEQSTPKAKFMTRHGRDIDDSFDDANPAAEFGSHTEQIPSSPEPKSRFEGHVAEAAAAAGLISTLGYFASSPSHPETKESFLDELPSVPQLPSPVEPMTKDRSSYLLQSSPMTTKFEESESADQELVSPSWKQKSSRSSSTAMESIQEREVDDVFGSPNAISEDPKYEETIDTLSVPPHDDLADQEKARESLDQQSIDFQDRKLAAPVADEAEPVDEFTYTKSKKDKKKNKKDKGLSRSSTQDDFVIPEFSNITGPAEAGPADDELFVTKSKKDKKREKKKSKSVSVWNPDEDESISQQIQEPVLDSAREVPEDIAVPADVERLEGFSAPKSKKDKKGKRKSVVTWEPDAFDRALQMTEQTQEEPTRAAHGEVSTPIADEPVDDFSISKSNKKKKKDKKATSAWEPEEGSFSQPLPEPTIEESREVVEKPSFLPEAEPSEKLSTKSKKDRKRDKKSSKSTPAVGSERDGTEAQALETSPDLIEEPVSTFHGPPFVTDTMTTEPTGDVIESRRPEDQEELTETKTISRDSQPEVTADLTKFQAPEDHERDAGPESIFKDSLPEKIDGLIESQKPENQEVAAGLDSISNGRRPEPAGDLIESQTPEDQEGSAEPEFISKDSQPKTNDDVARDAVTEDSFTARRTKKSDKKKGKLATIWQEEGESVPSELVSVNTQQDSTRDFPEATPTANDFFVTKSKKGKKDKKKRFEAATAWEPEEDPASTPIAQEVDDIQDFEEATFKKGKKKKKSSSFVADGELASASRQEPFENLVTQDDTPPTDVLELNERQVPAQSLSTTEQVKTREPENIFDAPESLSSKPTPMGGPGAWPITPATPWTGGEVPDSSSKEYFPSTETSHSPSNREIPEVSQSKSYFPSAEIVLPIVAASAALLGENSLKKDSSPPSEELAKDATTSESKDLQGPSVSQSDVRPSPDGFSAGYDNDQLSLAKRLQEEFSSGSKKSKKDKKRQSLPPTPARELSRSRTVEEVVPDSHPRARSLSIGPSTAARAGSSPLSGERENIYSEDQLELARQLKADFESGGKKSKKDKKKRQGLSRSSTQDDMGFDRDMESPQMTIPNFSQDSQDPETSETVPKGDGFAAGYEEDQLSLARQLQAEFGKKSKKDKKRRSTAQTPQDQELRDDIVDEPSRVPISDMMEQEGAAHVPESNAQDMARDGLAVGYSEEQLELARQLKEEFGSGSKKGKKEKKDKKRRSTSQTPLEQEPNDDYFGGSAPVPVSDDIEQDQRAPTPESNADTGLASENLALGYNEEELEPARQLKEEFGSSSKKSKKDKKDKKRGSLLRTNTEDEFSFDAQPRDGNNSEALQTLAGVSTSNETQDDSTFVTKKSKKDKKGKKRASLLPETQGDAASSELISQPADEEDKLRDLDGPASASVEEATSEAVQQGDDFAFTTKSKKGKKGKKRDSVLQIAPENDLPDEPQFDSKDQSRDVEAPHWPDFAQEFSAEPEDEFTSLTKKSKKSKKDKKRQSLLQASPENDLPDETRLDSQDQSRDVEVPAQPDFSQEFSAEPEEEFTSLTKKSKKDKKSKKRDSVLQTAPEDDLPSETPFDSEDLTRDADAPSHPDITQEFSDEPVAAEPEDESSAFTKKFENDETGNKGYSATRSATDNNTPSDDFGKEVEALHAARDKDPSDIDLEPTQPAPEDDWSVPVKEDETLHAFQDAEFREIDVEPAQAVPGDNWIAPEQEDEALYNTHNVHSADIDLEPAQAVPEGDWGFPEKENKTLHANEDAMSREIDHEPAQVAPEEDWTAPAKSAKKDKKDKKKRQSTIAQEESSEQQDFEAESAQPEEQLPTPNPTSEVVEEPTDDLSFSSKKSKKDKKKRGNLLRSSTFDETPEEQFKEIQPQLENRELVDDVASASTTYSPLADNQDDAFEYSSKKSKKDKKKRGTQLRSSTFDEKTEDQVKDGEIQPELESQDLVYDASDKSAPLLDDQGEEYQYSSKKSKKDKKKRGSLLRSSTLDEAPAEQVLESETQPELESRELGDDAGVSVAPSADNQDDEFGYSSKRSKKDKKMRKSSQPTPSLEDLPKDLEEPLEQDDAVSNSVLGGFRPLILETDPSPEIIVPETIFNEDILLTQPTNIMAERDAPEATLDKDEPLHQSSNINIEQDIPEATAHGPALDLDISTNQPEEGGPNGGPPDIFHDFAFTTKKSKKDKKKWKDSNKDDSEEASGLSTPVGPKTESKPIVESAVPTNAENAIAIDEPLNRDTDAVAVPASEQQDEEQPTDEWSFSSVKTSRKDQKRKGSSRSASVTASVTPLEPILEPEVANQASQPPTRDFQEDIKVSEDPLSRAIEEPSSQVSEHPPSIAAEENLETQVDEWPSFSTKKSKKDKKKSKSLSRSQCDGPSDISIPIVEPEMSVVEPSFPTENVPEEPPANELPRDLENITDITTKDESAGLVDEWTSPSTKKSKKDKKKRKSGLSTPAELMEEASTFEPEKAFAEASRQPAQAEADVPIIEEPASKGVDNWPEISKARVQNFQDLEAVSQESKDQETTDEAFAFVTKRSKKDKKGGKKSSSASESRPSRSIPSDPLPREIGAETEPPLPPEQIVSSPVAMKDEEFANTDQLDRYDDEPAGDDERKVAFGGGIRTSSKKDKRKRQATVADISLDAMGASKPPLTSWADEVEEAEIERETPVIQDIAKDETLSHIASTTESVAVDDFFRPTKKGKKGKKRFSEPASSVESSRPATSSGMPKDEVADDHNNIAILAATGAAFAGAGLLNKDDDIRESPSESAGATTPRRKLSKKEKKKKSIDLGPTPRDDIFDNPALWEGAEPKAHEEIRHIDDDDAGSDGFGFSSRDMDESMSTHDPYERREPTPVLEEHIHVEEVRPVSPATEAQPALRESTRNEERAKTILLEDHHTATETAHESRDLPRETQDVRHEVEMFDRGPSMGEEHITQLAPRTHDPEEAIRHREDVEYIGQPHFSEPSRSMADTPPSDKGVSFEEPLPIIHEHISTSSRHSDEQVHGDRSLAFEDIADNSPARPLSTSKFGRTSFGDLPVVHEESEPLPPPHHDFEANRDSAFVTGSPIPRHQFTDDHEHVRDSGVHLRDISPAERVRTHVTSTDDALARLSWPQVDDETETVDLNRSQRPVVKTPTDHHHQERIHSETHDSHSHGSRQDRGDKLTKFNQSPMSAVEKSTHHEKPLTSRDLFPSYKSTEEKSVKHHDGGTSRENIPSHHSSEEKDTDLHRVPTIHGSRKPREDSLVKQRLQRFESPDLQRPVMPKEDKYAELTASQKPKAERHKGMSDVETGAAIAGATLGFAAARKLSQEQRPTSAQSQRSSSNINRLRTPDTKRPDSGASNRSGTPPLRRSDRKLSGDLRSLSQRSKPDLAKEAELAAFASATSASQIHTPNPTANEGRVRAKDMATDVYVRFWSFDDKCDANTAQDGFGEGRMGSPRSPTRPHSMRRRQSMQVLDLESKVEQLIAENRMLAEAKAQAEQTLASTSHTSTSLIEKDTEIDSLKRTLDWLQNEVTRLTQVNEGLNSAHIELGRQHNDRYGALESQHAQATRELQEVHDAHDSLSAGMEGIVRNQVQGAVQEKDQEIAQLRAELDAAKEQIREMQRQILASKANEVDFLTVRDEDYFDNACQSLCQHVQQWVLRFSKFSDMRACRLSSEINNEKTLDRLDNAILDGSDVDTYLADRIKRRDVFMSMTMNMVWEFIFTRYLFGMDREQRQKLKSLEKMLSEVGPAAAVHHWRATTLTLLSKRKAFVQQREQDTQAVVHAIIETLSEILPPPSHLETQIEEQLTRVMKEAVDLSIEMRTQLAEYMMLPPLLPEYDANGDLASKVSFNAALMNERSGDTVSNEELEEQKAVVRVVLFPLVVKRGDDRGEGDEEIVVCPAQVLVAKPKKTVRVFSPESVQGHSRISLQSSMPADHGEGSVI